MNYQSFSIGSDERVQFVQPSSRAITLNRVVGANGSELLGQLQANGRVFLINPNGILFGPSAQIDVGGLVASTLSLTDDEFWQSWRFTADDAGSIVNQGNINAGEFIAFINPQITNKGR